MTRSAVLTTVALSLAVALCLSAVPSAEEEYTRVIQKRADGVIAALDLKGDDDKAREVREALLAQYRALRDWHDANDAELKKLTKGSPTSARAEEIRASLKTLHDQFLSRLAKTLTAEQVERVKDEMTYNVVRVTYRAYGEMLPGLTDEQKATIMEMLKAAREEAMDGGSSEEKHAIFGRYKGRINNYLSAQGYDLKKASKEFNERQRKNRRDAQQGEQQQQQPKAEREQLKWKSGVTGGDVAGRVLVPRARSASLGAVVYLKNLSIPRLGRESDERIVGDLLNDGNLVLELDYARHPSAVGPDLQADVLRLRREINDRTLLSKHEIDLARVFILPEGFRLRRDVEFCRDGERVLAMDICYPADSAKPVAALMEITCDNANRMSSGSLVYCQDTLLEGGMFAGFAVAMIDHPVAPPYKGIDDPMPDVLLRLKAAVRTLRSVGREIGLNGQIGVMGFSRGSNMAALLATTGGLAELKGKCGAHRDVSSHVQAALVHGGRFDFSRLRPDDPMLERFTKAWGPRETSGQRWDAHGAAHYLRPGHPAAPMFLNTSDAEAPEFRDQLAVLAERLKAAGVGHVYSQDADARGHRVSTDPKTLGAIYSFFAKHLATK